MSLGDVNNLNFGDCRAAVQQVFNSANFVRYNPHLSPAERFALTQDPVRWPLKPVFSPFATTHHGYSQVRFSGTKYLVHRLSLRLFHGRDVGSDVSHTLHLGPETGRNINPRHLVEEGNVANQTRKLCAAFFDKWWWLWDLGALGEPGWADRDSFVAARGHLAFVCSFVHPLARCSCWDPAWGDRAFFQAGFQP